MKWSWSVDVAEACYEDVMVLNAHTLAREGEQWLGEGEDRIAEAQINWQRDYHLATASQA